MLMYFSSQCDHRQADHEGHRGGQEDRTPGRLDRIGGDVEQLEEAGADHGGDGQQEGVLGRRLAPVAQGETGRDGRPGPGDAGDQGQRLGQAEEDAVAPGEGLDRPHVLGEVVDDADHDAEAGQHRDSDPQVAQRVVDRVLEQQAEHHDRDRADDHQPAHPGLGIVPRQLARPGPGTSA